MDLYVIRRPSGWDTGKELEAAAARSAQVGDEEMSSDIRWIRSYVVREADGDARHVLHLPGVERGEDPRARAAGRPARHRRLPRGRRRRRPPRPRRGNRLTVEREVLPVAG